MEKEIFEIIKNIFISANIDIEPLGMKENKTNFTICYFNSVLCLIKISKKAKFLSFDIKHRKLFDESFNITQLASDFNRFRVNIVDVEDVERMSSQLIEILSTLTVPATFDICSRYMECSEQGKCVHPDKWHSRECSYKRKLESGIIFYGSNRNI